MSYIRAAAIVFLSVAVLWFSFCMFITPTGCAVETSDPLNGHPAATSTRPEATQNPDMDAWIAEQLDWVIDIEEKIEDMDRHTLSSCWRVNIQMWKNLQRNVREDNWE